MFTYLNPAVRKKLISTGKLIRIDRTGTQLQDTQPSDDLVINLLGPIPLPINLAGVSCTVQWYAAVRSTELAQVEALADNLRDQGGQNLFASLADSMAVNSVLVVGDPQAHDSPLVRVHSNCLTGDVFGSERCECGPQLARAVERLNADQTGGLIVYMAGHEGRGIGLWAKAATYLLQDAGEDTYQANESLGLPADSRDFTDAAALILHFLGNRPVRILTNNPKKLDDLYQSGLTQLRPEEHIAGVTQWNKRYLAAKKGRGHNIKNLDLD